MTTSDFKNNNSGPSASPSKPSANFIATAIKLYRLQEVNEITINEAEEIAMKMFEVLGASGDYEVLNGEIDPKIIDNLDFGDEIKNDPTLKSYIRIINSLFKLAADDEIGARKTLSRELVNNYDIKTAARANCMGGGVLLDNLCDSVNQELMDRKPSISPSGFKFKQLGEQNNLQNNPE